MAWFEWRGGVCDMFLWWKMRERACILNMVVVKLG